MRLTQIPDASPAELFKKYQKSKYQLEPMWHVVDDIILVEILFECTSHMGGDPESAWDTKQLTVFEYGTEIKL